MVNRLGTYNRNIRESKSVKGLRPKLRPKEVKNARRITSTGTVVLDSLSTLV